LGEHHGLARFADWLERNAGQAVVFAQRTGLNTVIVDSTDDYQNLVRGLALTLCRCSGTARTTPQNILLPATGVMTDEGHKSPRDFGADLGEALDRLLGHPVRVARLLGAITGDEVRSSLAEAARHGAVVHASQQLGHPDHPEADVRGPLVVRVTAAEEHVYAREWPGPVSFLVGTESTLHSLAVFRRSVARHGALYAAVHSTDPLVLAAAETAALDTGVPLVQNLADDLPADPSSAVSDPPGAGAHFVTGRFRVMRSRWRAAAPDPSVLPVPAADALVDA